MAQLPPWNRSIPIAGSAPMTTRFADWMLLVWTALNRLIAGLFDVAITTPGVIFPSTQVPSANPNTLDDYEEGTWTPTIGGTGGETGQVYAQQDGAYVKVGRLVHVGCRVQLSTLGTITGVVQIKGLPFTSLNASGYRATATVVWTTTTTAYVSMAGSVADNAAGITLVATAAATTTLGTQFLVQNDLANTTRFILSVEYEANA